jgi:hypothetical protein
MKHVRAASGDATTSVQPCAMTLCCLLLLGATGVALGQTSPAQGPLPTASIPAGHDDREMADYLALLQRIAPASEAGARTYLAAIRLRCGQTLDAAALRRAMARAGGDPVLMGLIRAAATQDRTARDQSVAQIQCPREERR